MMMLFKTLVAPILEYSSVVWSPHKKEDIRKIERIQQNYSKRLSHTKDLNYHQRLSTLNTYSLERRRERYDLLYAYKIMKGDVPNICLQFKWSSRRGRMLVPPPVSRNSTCAAKTIRHNSYRSRVSRLFNSLPQALRNTDTQCSMERIKHLLDNHLGTVPDEPQQLGYPSALPSNSLYHHGMGAVRHVALDQ